MSRRLSGIVVVADAGEIGRAVIGVRHGGGFDVADGVAQQQFDFIEGGDFALAFAAERQIDGLQDGRVGQVGHRQMGDAVAGAVGVQRVFAQEARRETVEQRLARAHGGERDARQAMMGGDRIGESRRLQPGLLEQRPVGRDAPAGLVGLEAGRQRTHSNEVVLETRNGRNRHELRSTRIEAVEVPRSAPSPGRL